MNSSMQSNDVRKNLNYCVHTKHVYSLLDMPANEEAYKKLKKHLELCASCSDEFHKFQLKTAAAQVYIPKVLMDHDLKQSFEREVGELFKVMDLDRRQNLKRKVKTGFRFVDTMGLDFIKNLVSKTMFKSYLLALAIFICLKFLL